MDRIDKDALARSVSLRDYVEARVGAPYKKHGRAWVWSSPFRTTTGNSPSFTVWDSYKGGPGRAKDFGGNETYDIYKFIQSLDGVTFPEAVQSLNEWANGSPVARIIPKRFENEPKSYYREITWSDVNRTELHYPQVRSYIETKRKISGEIAHKSHLGAVTWSKLIEYNGKTERIPVNRATFPYYFNGNVHGWVSRRDDPAFLERLDFEFQGIVEHTRNLVWQGQLKKDSDADLRNVSDVDVIEAIHGNLWTPKDKQDKYNFTALSRWHQMGRRSLYNVDRYCKIVNGVYTWSARCIIIHESETDALACDSETDEYTANVAYKDGNKLAVPLWMVLGQAPIAVYLAVQNDEASRNFARQLSGWLAYTKENYNKSKYVVNYLYTPSGFKDFGEMQQAGKLRDFFQAHAIGAR